MKKLHVYVMIILAILFAACKDDTFNLGDYSEGEPALIDLRINIPEENRIMSRSLDADMESRVNQLVMIGFEEGSGRKIFHNLTDNIESYGTPANGQRYYKLKDQVATYSGKYRIYFIANWSSVYANMTIADIEAMSESEIINTLTFTNTDGKYELYGDYGFPMTATTEIQIQPSPAVNNLTGVSLERTTAHIEFQIQNGPEVNGLQPNFVPTGYTVYRMPKSAPGMNKSAGRAEVLTTTVFDGATEPIVKASPNANGFEYSFDFFMLENNQNGALTAQQTAALTATGANQGTREDWDYDYSKDISQRKFTNAPEYATYVVLTGNYTGPAEKDANGYTSTEYHGPVTYIIHLGNFNTSNGGSLTNFNVNRNEYHTYTITVNGANSIFCNVEVSNPNRNPAVEGYLSSQPITQLDAHYEKVMLKFPKVTIKHGSDKNQVLLATVKNGFNNELKNVDELTDADDYKWIQFQKPTSDAVFPQYAGINESTGESLTNSNGDTFVYLPELVQEMVDYLDGTNTNPEHVMVSGDDFVVAAFVDENIYSKSTDPAIISWANSSVKDRIMQLSPTQLIISPDEQSVIASGSAFNIQQCPVISTYSLNPNNVSATERPTYNPFGFERIEEPTTAIADNDVPYKNYTLNAGGYNFYGSAYQWDIAVDATVETSSINNSNARSLMLELFTAFNAGVDLESIGDNDSFHQLSGATSTNQTYSFVPKNFYKVTQAICSRNRDLNGDGQLTSDEIRWYIPGIVQYYIYNFGQNIVPDELRLVSAEEDNISLSALTFANGSASGDYAFPRYLTSARTGRRLFWQDQRGATSALGTETGYFNWVSTLNNIRFARNLGQFTNAYSADFTRMSQRNSLNRTIRIINKDISRQFSWTTAYPYATALEQYNLLPEAFEYADEKLTLFLFNSSGSTPSQTTVRAQWTGKSGQDLVDAMNQTVLDAYNAKHGTSLTALPNGWRIPNQRELIAMYITGILDASSDGSTYFDSVEIEKGTIYCSTFIKSDLWAARSSYPFQISGGYLVLAKDYMADNMTQGYVVLVRDVDPNTGEPIATQTSTANAKLRAKGVVRKK